MKKFCHPYILYRLYSNFLPEVKLLRNKPLSYSKINQIRIKRINRQAGRRIFWQPVVDQRPVFTAVTGFININPYS